MVELKIQEIISFFDEGKSDDRQHSSSLNALAGEDLGSGLLKHYFESIRNETGEETKILGKPIGIKNEGSKRGKWLDKWVEIPNEEILFQVEIKNWCSHSLGQETFLFDEDEDKLKEKAIKNFNGIWSFENENFWGYNIGKVLDDMKIPDSFSAHTVLPLVCVWFPICPSKESVLLPFFELGRSTKKFNKVCFFSMSLYLRELKKSGKQSISIEAPNIEKRVKVLNSLFSIKN